MLDDSFLAALADALDFGVMTPWLLENISTVLKANPGSDHRLIAVQSRLSSLYHSDKRTRGGYGRWMQEYFAAIKRGETPEQLTASRRSEMQALAALVRKLLPATASELAGSEGSRLRLGANSVVMLDNRGFSVKPNGYKLFELLLKVPGEYVPLARNKVRTRDVESLPPMLRDAVESDPGAGTRIKREYLA